MATVYGPRNRVQTTMAPPTPFGWSYKGKEKTQNYYVSKPVTLDPHPYLMREFTGNGQCDPTSWSFPYDRWYDTTRSAQALKKAYDRLKGAIDEPASLAVSIAERKQAISMMTTRVMQIFRFSRALRKGRFDDAAKELGLLVPPRRSGFNPRVTAKNFGNLWLELHLGWKPLIGDIYSCLDVLQRGLPPFTVRGRAGYTKEEVFGNAQVDTYRLHREKVQLNATILVSDPNLWRANQLGLINPAVVVWELVPFSFVLDWFVPVGDFLSQYTDFVGLNLSRTSTTYYTTQVEKRFFKDGTILRDQKKQAVVVERIMGIATPPLVYNRVTGLSVTRAATAVSLLLQTLRP